MQAIGMIETKGLLAAIEGADSMTKSANVEILEKEYIGGGLVTITITGDVGAVRAAIDAGVTAIKSLSVDFLISEHVIPRPHEELKKIIRCEKGQKIINSEINNSIREATIVETEVIQIPIEEINEVFDSNIEPLKEMPKIEEKKITKKDIEEYLEKDEKEILIYDLNNLKISELRKLLKEHKEQTLTSKMISKMDKENLIRKILEIYNIRGEE